jgi:hypothetical protein
MVQSSNPDSRSGAGKKLGNRQKFALACAVVLTICGIQGARECVPFSVLATIMGWSASTTVRMAKRYGHIGQAAQRQAGAEATIRMRLKG